MGTREWERKRGMIEGRRKKEAASMTSTEITGISRASFLLLSLSQAALVPQRGLECVSANLGADE